MLSSDHAGVPGRLEYKSISQAIASKSARSLVSDLFMLNGSEVLNVDQTAFLGSKNTIPGRLQPFPLRVL